MNNEYLRYTHGISEVFWRPYLIRLSCHLVQVRACSKSYTNVRSKHETPHSTSTLQANGHKLPRPHVGMIRENGKDVAGNLNDEFLVNQPTTERSHRISGHGYQHHRKHNNFPYKYS